MQTLVYLCKPRKEITIILPPLVKTDVANVMFSYFGTVMANNKRPPYFKARYCCRLFYVKYQDKEGQNLIKNIV